MQTELIRALAAGSGLSEEALGAELKKLCMESGVSYENLDLENLRILVGELLQNVLVDVKEELARTSGF